MIDLNFTYKGKTYSYKCIIEDYKVTILKEDTRVTKFKFIDTFSREKTRRAMELEFFPFLEEEYIKDFIINHIIEDKIFEEIQVPVGPSCFIWESPLNLKAEGDSHVPFPYTYEELVVLLNFVKELRKEVKWRGMHEVSAMRTLKKYYNLVLHDLRDLVRGLSSYPIHTRNYLEDRREAE